MSQVNYVTAHAWDHNPDPTDIIRFILWMKISLWLSKTRQSLDSEAFGKKRF